MALNRKNRKRPIKPAKRNSTKPVLASPHAKAAHLELDTDIKGTIEARIPGHTPIAFNDIKGVLKIAIEEVFGGREIKHKAA